MKNTRSLPSLGSYVRFPLSRGGFSYGTISQIDRRSSYARAYGAQVKFADSPYSACLAQCTIVEKLTHAASPELARKLGLSILPVL